MKEFYFTPDTIRKMSNLDITKIMTMLNTYNKVQNREINRK